jgi:type VI secretion system protein ImpK
LASKGSTAPGGPGAAQGIRRDLYETIRRAQSKTIEDLSPHWRGQDVPLSGSRLQVPVWAVAALAAVVLLASYLYLRNALSARAETLALRMAEIHPAGGLTLARETIVPPPDPAEDVHAT